jgi:hypothetical protein
VPLLLLQLRCAKSLEYDEDDDDDDSGLIFREPELLSRDVSRSHIKDTHKHSRRNIHINVQIVRNVSQ